MAARIRNFYKTGAAPMPLFWVFLPLIAANSLYLLFGKT